jgi:lipopolysaccharide/colanic/teichoic acid biosynthesis glycosyltransferase
LKRHSVGLFFKRLFDVLVAAFALVILFPILAIVALFVKATSSGPVFYRGVRTGRDGKPFRVFKYRTMVQDAEMLGGPSTGLHDPRVTGIGRVLRKYKIDELPNLINVVIGQMSLVGPRPEVPRYTSLYSGDEELILTVRPGITDLSSIRYIDLASHIGSENVDENFEEYVLPEKNRLRVEYVKTQTFFGDLVIIFRTLTRLVIPSKREHGVH